MEPKTMTVSEAAKALHTSASTVLRAIKEGKLRVTNVVGPLNTRPKEYKILVEDVERLKASAPQDG